jgi:hypothetical protein
MLPATQARTPAADSCASAASEETAATMPNLVPGHAKVAIVARYCCRCGGEARRGRRVVLLPVDLEHDSPQPEQQHQKVHALVE